MTNYKLNTKRILAWVLTLILVCTVIPVTSVSATGADTYVPLTIASGFTADIVVEKGSTIVNNEIKTATYFDGNSSGADTAMYEQGTMINTNTGTYGLPSDRLLTFTHSNQEYKYQLAAYTGNNAAQISRESDSASPTSGTFIFTTPGAYSRISILGAAGNGNVTFNATVRYTDNTTENKTFIAPNWATNDYCKVGRIKLKTNEKTVGTFDDYVASLYHFEIDTNPTKLIKQLEFTYQSDTGGNSVARANLIAVSGCIPGTAPAAPTTTAATSINGSGFTANWTSVDNVTKYYLDISTYSDFNTLLTNYNNKEISGTSCVVTGLDNQTTYYYRVRAGNSSAQSNSSNITSVITVTPVPTIPTDLIDSIEAIDGLEVEWDDNTGTLTVTGEATGEYYLNLIIQDGIIIDWQADLTSSACTVVEINEDSGVNSVFKMTGGSITNTSSLDGNSALYNNSDNTDIIILDGTITGNGDTGYCIYNDSTGIINIEGGKIINYQGQAIYYTDDSTSLNISGDAVIFGKDTESVINKTTQPTPEDDAIIITWTGGSTTYNQDESTDLILNPSTATAKWGKEGDKHGVFYENNTNNGFIEIAGVVVDGGTTNPTGPKQIGTSDAYWELSGTEPNLTLTITGTGEIPYLSTLPWEDDKNNITEIVIEEGLTVLPEYLFNGHDSVKNITVASTVTKVKQYAFSCSTLEKVIFKGETPPTFVNDAFKNVPTTGKVIVPADTATTYTNALNANPVLVIGENAWIIEEESTDTVINISAIQGVEIPIAGATPVTTIIETDQYTGTVSWNPTVSGAFAYGQIYTATINITPKSGYTLTGIAQNFFTITGATNISNSTNSGVVTVVFPATEKPIPTKSDFTYKFNNTTYDKTQKSVTVSPKTGIGTITAIKYNGSTTAPTDAGTYSITVDVEEGTTYGASTDVILGEWIIEKISIIIKADDKSKNEGSSDPLLTYTITSGSLITGDALTGKLTRLAGEKAGIYAIISTLANKNYMIDYLGGNLTITSPAIPNPTAPTGGINGTVTDNSGLNLPIVVTINLGNKMVASVVTNNNNSFEFTNLIDGFYNLVADNGEYKTTKIIQVTGGNIVPSVNLELGKKQSIVEVKETADGAPITPDVAVGGLSELFPDSGTNTIFTLDDQTIIDEGGTIEIKFVAEAKADTDTNGEAVKIQTAATGKKVSTFIDFSVIKTAINNKGISEPSESISLLDTTITVVFPIPYEAKNDDGTVKDGITIYRVHNNLVNTIPQGSSKANDGEYFEIDGDNIILHIKKFSTYAVGYTDDKKNEDQGGNTGGGITTTNAQNPTISAQPKDASIKVGETTTLTVEAKVTDSGTISYQWYANTSATNTGGTAIVGATDTKYTIPVDKAGVFYYYVVVTNTNNSVNGSKTATTASNAVTITVTENDTETKQFTVTYKKNGGGTVSGILSDKAKYDNGSKVTVIGIPVSTSKFFAGWNTKADGTGKSYTARKTFKITGDVTLYAQWKNTVTDNKKLKYKVTGKNKVACIGTTDKDATNIAIGETVKYKGITYKIISIAKNAFKGNDKITTVKIGNNVKIIDKKAFFKCTNLEKVTIGTGLITLNNHVFCHTKEGIVVIINSKKLKTVKTSTNHGTKNMVIKVPKSKLDAYKKLFVQTSKTVMVEAKAD